MSSIEFFFSFVPEYGNIRGPGPEINNPYLSHRICRFKLYFFVTALHYYSATFPGKVVRNARRRGRNRGHVHCELATARPGIPRAQTQRFYGNDHAKVSTLCNCSDCRDLAGLRLHGSQLDIKGLLNV